MICFTSRATTSRAGLAIVLTIAVMMLGAAPTLAVDGNEKPPAPRGLAIDRLPLAFLANAGQSDPNVRFEARGFAGSIALSTGGVALSLPISPRESDGVGTVLAPAGTGLMLDLDEPLPRSLREHRTAGTAQVGVRFLGASKAPELVASGELPGRVNFFIGRDSKKWRTDLPTWRRITYEQLYPGIDLVYDGREGRLKGTYLVAPGADPSAIRWAYTGARRVRLDGAGNLVLELPAAAGMDGRVTEMAPVAWQTVEGRRVSVDVRFVLAEDGSARFALGRYDRGRALVIDPTLIFSSLAGGNGTDHCLGVEMDAAGNMFVTGRTHSNPAAQGAGWPVTSGSFGTSYGGEVADAFVMKIDPTTSTILWSGYLGGGDPVDFSIHGGADWGLGICLDDQDNVHVVGFTEADNFPITANALMTAKQGGEVDAFYAMINPQGNQLLYSTYLGGVSDDFAFGVAADSNGLTYLSGITQSIDFPVTAGAPIQYPLGLQDAFLTIIDRNNGLRYSTFIGGSGVDQALDLDLGPAGSGLVYVAGLTWSQFNAQAFPSLQGINLVQPLNAGMSDAFLAVFSPDGNGVNDLVYFTFLGGSGPDNAFAVDVNDLGDAYLTGEAGSTDFNTKLQQFPIFGMGDSYVARIRPAGNGIADLFFSVVIGAGEFDFGFDVKFYDGEVYYCGLITTLRSADGFWIRLSNFGQLLDGRLISSLFFDMATGLDVNATGIAVVGYTKCLNSELNYFNCVSDFPLVNAYQTVYGGGSGDGWVQKWTHQ